MDSTTYAAGIFAGFRLPRTENGPTIYNPTHGPKTLAARLRDWLAHGKTRGCIGRVTYANRIRSRETARDFSGWGFYLEDDSRALGLRLRWADDVARSIRHAGWYLDDDDGAGDTVRGFVLTLPHGRGFLAGYSLGVGMLSSVDAYVYDPDDETGAALAADSMAENMAEREREYRAEHDDDETDGEG